MPKRRYTAAQSSRNCGKRGSTQLVVSPSRRFVQAWHQRAVGARNMAGDRLTTGKRTDSAAPNAELSLSGPTTGGRLREMDWKQRVIQLLAPSVISRNERFKGRHEGETCYIIGNGASLKHMDLSAFDDRIAIGLNFLCIHRDFHKLNALYYVMPASRFLYPFYENPYSKKYQVNHTGKALKRAIARCPETTVFTSISNILALAMVRNVFYIHHFGNPEADRQVCDISGKFSFMAGGLHAGIGVAINLGFKKAILIGCDYVFTPTQDGHFYGAGPPVRSNRRENVYEKLFEEVAEDIDLSLVTDTCGSKWLPYEDYESYTGRQIRYRENYEIVDDVYLRMFDRSYRQGMYMSPIY